MTKNELKALLNGQSIKFSSRANKAELEALWEAEKDTEENLTAKARQKRGHKRQAETMKTTMAVEDRAIVNVDTGEMFDTCCAAWKADQFTSSQCDRLSGVLFKAVREGAEVPIVTLKGNGRWTLNATYLEGMTGDA